MTQVTHYANTKTDADVLTHVLCNFVIS